MGSGSSSQKPWGKWTLYPMDWWAAAGNTSEASPMLDWSVQTRNRNCGQGLPLIQLCQGHRWTSCLPGWREREPQELRYLIPCKSMPLILKKKKKKKIWVNLGEPETALTRFVRASPFLDVGGARCPGLAVIKSLKHRALM